MAWNRLARLLERDYQRFFIIALATTGDRGLAEDAVQDAVIAVAQGGRTPLRLAAYPATAVCNRAQRLLRNRGREVNDERED